MVFEERGNQSTRRSTSRSRIENQKIQATYDAESVNRARDTLSGRQAPLSPRQHFSPVIQLTHYGEISVNDSCN